MQNEFSAAAHWPGGFDEPALRSWAETLRGRLQARQVSLGLLFLSPRLAPQALQLIELLRVHARIPLLLGCSSSSLIAGDEEFEENAGLVLGLYHLPGAHLRAIHFTQAQLEEAGSADYWHAQTEVRPQDTNGWLVFADPFRLDSELWMRQWNDAYPGLPIVGGMAGGEPEAQSSQVYLNGQVFEEGGVALAVAGEVGLASVISQGCTPIGDTWTVTRAERNFIHEIANLPAYQVLAETFNQLPEDEKKKTRGNLFLGIASSEYHEEFHRGDFLIRNLIGADPAKGILAVAAFPRTGQTIQFQRRDAASSTEDMKALLTTAYEQLAGTPIYGACLCSCNGRGQRLFGEPHHDPRQVQQHLGPIGLAGFFCNGEIGPVGDRNFLHGYTASVALFVRKPPRH